MKLFRCDRASGRPVTQFESRNAHVVSLARTEGFMSVVRMEIGKDGVVGYHPATISQLFLVVRGEGWVRAGDGPRIPLATGEAAFWAPGERHESGSDEGMTAIVLEGEELDPRQFLPELPLRPRAIIEAYDQGVDRYGPEHSADDAWRERFRARFLEALPAGRVLDAGCGAGEDAQALSEAGLSVLAVDGSPRMVQRAQEVAPAATCQRGDFRVLDGVEPGLDGIWAMFSLVHLGEAELRRTLVRWRELVRDGAVLFVSLAEHRTKERHTIDDWLRVLGNPCTFFYHPVEMVERLLAETGFVVRRTWHETPRSGYGPLECEAYVVHAVAS